MASANGASRGETSWAVSMLGDTRIVVRYSGGTCVIRAEPELAKLGMDAGVHKFRA